MRLTVVYELLRALFFTFCKTGNLYVLPSALEQKTRVFLVGLWLSWLCCLLTKYKSGCQTDSTTNQLCLLRMRALCEFNNSFVVFFNNSVKWRHWSDSHAKKPDYSNSFHFGLFSSTGRLPCKENKETILVFCFCKQVKFLCQFLIKTKCRIFFWNLRKTFNFIKIKKNCCNFFLSKKYNLK